MIDRALNGEWNYIVVHKQDRFERDNVEEQVLLRQLESAGVYVLYAKGNIDPTTPTSQLHRWIMPGINQFYIRNLQHEIGTKNT
ncbi:MAG: site-specific recombinase [Mesotoga sp.]|nr:site-specific recombinase [Mesotoga sp.]